MSSKYPFNCKMKRKRYLYRLRCPFTYISSNPPLIHYVIGLLSKPRPRARDFKPHCWAHDFKPRHQARDFKPRYRACDFKPCRQAHDSKSCHWGCVAPTCIVGRIFSVPQDFKRTPKIQVYPNIKSCPSNILVHSFDLPFY